MFSQDFKEFIESLNANRVRYLIVGGYAVAFHGHPRYTKDLDVWIDRTPQNAARVVNALADFGFGSLDVNADDFLTPDRIIQLGLPPARIDILTTLPGVEFKNCFPKRNRVTMDGIPVNFIDLGNLRKNKKTVGRKQDLADLEKLE
ncbi:MAG: hypothetical protein HY782_14385 [Chloroflexi bacterium]|nr:hypothetical protein [Chloroflexota bacterium]